MIYASFCAIFLLKKLLFHAKMGYFGFDEHISYRLESHFFLVWHGVHLGVQAQFEGSIIGCFGGYLVHEILAETFVSLERQHTSDAHDAFLRIGEEARVGDNRPFAAQGEMRGEVVNVVFVEVMDVLLADKDAEAGFEDFV